MHRLITFLGTGTYHPTRYALADRDPAPATPWIAQALNWLLEPRPDETVVIATAKAWDTNGSRLCEAFRASGLGQPRLVTILEGRTERELWGQFEQLKRELRVSQEDLVTVDITHALRHQPFFAAGIISFVRMVDAKHGQMRVVYGAFELKREDVAPILELTPFVELIDWAHGLVMFLETGRFAHVSELFMKEKRYIGKTTRNTNALNWLYNSLNEFARDLQTIRTGALLLGSANNGRRQPSSARRLLEAVEHARKDIEVHMPALADVLDRIEEMARPLVFDGDALVGERARDVLAALAQLYVNMGRYVEALTTVREAFISLQGPAEIAAPGLPHYDHELREKVDNSMKHKLGNVFRSIVQFRNDLDHAGYQKQINPAKTLIEQAHKWAKEISKYTCSPSVFANISNHPSNEWSEDQRAAAREFAEAIIDVPFPEVPPGADGTWIEQKAEEVLASLPAETTHALVQGEFTLTMALVKRLQQRGIRCLAATSERRVSRTEDGRELREFRFVQFRDYPPLV